jgi:DNA-binding GntR family transcriptional regulator
MAIDRLSAEVTKFAGALTRRPNVPSQVANFIRELIIEGTLKPGERVVESKIARQLNIGQPTVREGLNTLVEEGLVVRQPGRGCCVVELTPKEVDQIFSLRLVLEPLAVEMALQTWADWKRTVLLEAFERLRQAEQEENIHKFYRCDLEFHKTLWNLAQNPFLTKALWQITQPLFAFVMIGMVSIKTFDVKSGLEEHEKIAQAVLSGDTEVAVRVVRAAIEKFRDWGELLIGQSESGSPPPTAV